jgi:hypothetical protein
LLQATTTKCIRRDLQPTFRTRPELLSSLLPPHSHRPSIRKFSNTRFLKKNKEDYAAQAKELNKKGQRDEEDRVNYDGQPDDKIGEIKELQARTPWHREGSDKPPVGRMRSNGVMTKGTFQLYHHPLVQS